MIKNNPKGPNGFWLCEDDGNIGNFSNEFLLNKVNNKDWDFFQDEYPPFLARVESLGLGFQTSGSIDKISSPINFDVLFEVLDKMQEMPSAKKEQMLEQLKVYRVHLFLQRK